MEYSKIARQGRELQRWDGWRRLTAGCVCYSRDGKILLVSSRNHAGEWTLPKGGWETDESVEQCAAREAWEEGGVRGAVVGSLGTFDIDGAPVKQKASRLFAQLLEVSEIYDEWPEQKERIRKWVELDKALEVVTRAGHVDALKQLHQRLAQHSCADRPINSFSARCIVDV